MVTVALFCFFIWGMVSIFIKFCGFVLQGLLPKPVVCDSELVWCWDKDPGAYTPDLDKDFDIRFSACMFRIKRQLPSFKLESHKKAVLDILEKQRNRLMWILNDLEKTMKIKCLSLGMLLVETNKGKDLVFKFYFGAETIEGTPVDISHKDITYSVDADGSIQVTS